MSPRSLLVALTSLAAMACGESQLLSPRSTWGEDFAVRSLPTDQCSGGTLTQLRTRMAVTDPLALAEIGADVPDSVRSGIVRSAKFYSFQYSTAQNSGKFWGFSGYLVARGDCIIHAEITAYDN